MNSRYFLFLIFTIVTFSKPHAQSLLKQPEVGVQGYFGSFLTHQPKALYLRDSYSYFAEVTLQQQTDGRKYWQVANGLPQVGVAVFFGNTGSKQYMGTMAGAFPYINWTLSKTPRFRGGLRAGAGLGWIQKPYNKITNHKNVLIGTHTNAYINFLWQADVLLFSNLHATAGLSFSHFSNGSSTLPNLGLNIPTLAVGLRYEGLKKLASTPRALDTLPRKNSFLLLTTVGLKQFPWIESNRFAVNTIQVEWSRPFWRSGRYSGGAIFFYDRALEVNSAGILDQKQKGNKFQAGVFAGYEHLFGRLSVPVQLGAYVFNQNRYTTLFQQLALRYRINGHWRAQLAMKTHSGKADFIHTGFGYAFK